MREYDMELRCIGWAGGGRGSNKAQEGSMCASDRGPPLSDHPSASNF